MRAGAVLTLAMVLSGACVASSPETTVVVDSEITSTTTSVVAPVLGEQVEPEGFSLGSLDWEDGTEAKTLQVYLADNNGRRKRGLMGVTTLGEIDGMVFVWDAPHEGGFWMKDTLIPLDIAFVSGDGVVIAVMTMEPCEEAPCASVGPDEPYLLAFESVAGTFDINVGDSMGVAAGSR